MNRLYEKNQLLFALLWIAVYVIALSGGDSLSAVLEVEKSATAVIGGLMTAVLLLWLKRNDLLQEYGLCRPSVPAGHLLYYVPLVLLASVNLWFGVTMNLSIGETCLYIMSMIFVGFLEELIFRGLLFKAMAKDNVNTAIVVSSITFGIGHIVNLFNGSGADLFSSFLQIGYAIAGGFLFTILFYKTKSLWACIFTHGILNSLSVFADESAMSSLQEVGSAAALTGISLGYAWYILKKVK